VAIVFHDTPSILQISRVLGVEWTDVSAALKPISSESYFDHLDLLDYNSDVKPRQNLKDSLLQRTGTVWLDPAKYHFLVAQWCLGDQTFDAR
jgi:hypothetical protein